MLDFNMDGAQALLVTLVFLIIVVSFYGSDDGKERER